MVNPSTWREVDSAFLTTQRHCSNKSSSPSKPTPPSRSLPSAYKYVTKSAIWKNNPLNPSHPHLAPHFSALLYRKTLQKNSRLVCMYHLQLFSFILLKPFQTGFLVCTTHWQYSLLHSRSILRLHISPLRMTQLIISSSPGNTFMYGGFQDATLPWFSPTSPGLLF